MSPCNVMTMKDINIGTTIVIEFNSKSILMHEKMMKKSKTTIVLLLRLLLLLVVVVLTFFGNSSKKFHLWCIFYLFLLGLLWWTFSVTVILHRSFWVVVKVTLNRGSMSLNSIEIEQVYFFT